MAITKLITNHPITGKITTYPLTRVGLYKLVNDLTYYVNDKTLYEKLCNTHIVSHELFYNAKRLLVLNHLINDCSYSPINEQRFLCDMQSNIICKLDQRICNIIGSYRFYLLSNNFVSFHNIKGTIKHGYCDIDDTFELNGHRYFKDLKVALKRCESCGDMYIEEESMPRGYCANDIEHDDLGTNGQCACCTHEKRCSECGSYEDNCTLNYCKTTGNYVCDDCVYENSDYQHCQRCGNLIYTPNDSDHVWTDNDNFYCCENCAEYDGYHYSERNDCWTDEEEYDLMLGYHNMRFYKVGEKPKNAKNWLGFGIEIEVCGNNPNSHYDFWNSIYSDCLKNGTYGELTEDGSVDLEIVTQPMTESAFNSFDLETMFKRIADKGYTSHDNNSCGQHIHFSREYLGYTNSQISQSAKKIAYFVNKYWDDMIKVSRRQESQLSWCRKPIDNINKYTDFRDVFNTRYLAVNGDNIFDDRKHTIEIRLPRGTLNPKTTRATVDFFLHIVRNAKNISWKNVDNLKLWFKGIKDQNTIDYIKSRNAFIGEF